MFDFNDLCNRPLATADYIALADRFHTLAVADVPVFNAANRAAAYRFVTLIDVMYEHRWVGAPDREVNTVCCVTSSHRVLRVMCGIKHSALCRHLLPPRCILYCTIGTASAYSTHHSIGQPGKSMGTGSRSTADVVSLFVEGSRETPLLALAGIELPHKGRRLVPMNHCAT
jgi:hypothetical protein